MTDKVIQILTDELQEFIQLHILLRAVFEYRFFFFIKNGKP